MDLRRPLLIQPRLQPLLVAGRHRCAGGTSALNVEDRLEREGLSAPAPAIPSIGDPQEVEHAGDPDAAGRKVKGLRTARQP